ncbi:MAG: hypothetical protein ABI330_05375, partial [Caldimonas sp.]
GPSRDLIVKRASPPNATGRVYGVVYSGLDIGQALAPLVFGTLMDMGQPKLVWLGIAAPSRDLIVKRAAPPNATGRVYGVVYSGLDIGQAAAPLAFGPLLDMHRASDIWLMIAIVQGLMIASAFNVGRVRRTPLAPAAAAA